MAKQLESASVSREERTFRVERETPSGGSYRLRIHRETISRLSDGTVIGRQERIFAYDEEVTKALARPAAKKYLAAIQAAKSLQEAMAAEANLYDDLVAEVDAERALELAEAEAGKAKAP